ncbi:MAG: helix-turn-helix domain-containing protein [bacterium]
MKNLENIETFLSRLITPIIQRCVKESLQEFHFPEKTEKADKLMSIQEAAKFLSLAIPTLYGMTSKHTIPYRKRGKKIYFKESELTAWLDAGKKKSVSELDLEADDYLTKKG